MFLPNHHKMQTQAENSTKFELSCLSFMKSGDSTLYYPVTMETGTHISLQIHKKNVEKWFSDMEHSINKLI